MDKKEDKIIKMDYAQAEAKIFNILGDCNMPTYKKQALKKALKKGNIIMGDFGEVIIRSLYEKSINKEN